MNHLDLFSGIGGFHLAGEMVWGDEFNTIAHIEIDPFCQKVLKKHWPNVSIISDIKELTKEKLWQEHALSAKKEKSLQTKKQEEASLIANRANQHVNKNGATKTNKGDKKQIERGVEKRKMKSLSITGVNVPVVEKQQKNFLPSTINSTMEIQKEENTNRKHGKSLLNEDSQMTTRSSVIIATTQKQYMESVHIKKGLKIDLLTAGPPCQPASCAGKQRGTKDDRWLWSEVFRIVREFKPTWIIIENVKGLLALEQGVVFESLLTELESIGYEVQPLIIPACAQNAPHRRDRVWIVGHSNQFNGNHARHDSGQISQLEEAEVCGLQSKTNQSQRLRNGRWDEPWIDVATRLCRIFNGLSGELDKTNRLKALGNAIVPQIVFQIMQAINNIEGK